MSVAWSRRSHRQPTHRQRNTHTARRFCLGGRLFPPCIHPPWFFGRLFSACSQAGGSEGSHWCRSALGSGLGSGWAPLGSDGGWMGAGMPGRDGSDVDSGVEQPRLALSRLSAGLSSAILAVTVRPEPSVSVCVFLGARCDPLTRHVGLFFVALPSTRVFGLANFSVSPRCGFASP